MYDDLGCDVRMIERGQHLRFPLEACQPLGVVDEGFRKDLQRNIAVELGVTGFFATARRWPRSGCPSQATDGSCLRGQPRRSFYPCGAPRTEHLKL